MSYPGQGNYNYGGGQQYDNRFNNDYAQGPPPGNRFDSSFNQGSFQGNRFDNDYNRGPPTQQYSGYNQGPPPGPPPQNYGGYNSGPPPPQQNYDRFGPSGGSYNQLPPQQYDGYNQGPPPQQQSYDRFGPPSGSYNQTPPQNYQPAQPQYNGNGGGQNFQAPPQQMQTYGPNQNMSFQYSNCTGRRKALLIGINYQGQKGTLRGCINDVKNVKRFLESHGGYKEEDMVILTDEPNRGPKCQPTRANIIRGMQWLVSGARPNDSLFLHYSGHGGQTEDLDGDEDDGYDEVIYPVDYQQAGHIVDDDIHAITVRPLMPGVRLTALFDSCHSGTVLDLPYVYSTKGVLKEPNLLKDAGSSALTAAMSYAKGDIQKTISSVTGIFKRVSNNNSNAYEVTKRTRTAPCDAILISGCKDSQTSADAYERGQATGAMSYAFIHVMSTNPNQSYLTLLRAMREVLAGKYDQKPQLSSSHPIDCNLKFIF